MVEVADDRAGDDDGGGSGGALDEAQADQRVGGKSKSAGQGGGGEAGAGAVPECAVAPPA
ncbi:hypothetical protein [Streptomyces griseosporeus]|uniref:hypothetical protein n=1 Tax=Streptomyces griseosporeus TaxID=1910 RepID=UPI0036FCE2F1